jgi:hypothetical protein
VSLFTISSGGTGLAPVPLAVENSTATRPTRRTARKSPSTRTAVRAGRMCTASSSPTRMAATPIG